MAYCTNCRETTARESASCAACGARLVMRGWHPVEGETSAQAERPRPARTAVWLLSAALLPNLILSALFSTAILSMPTLLSSLLLTGFSALLIYNISRGRDWARVSYLFVFILSSVNIPTLLENIAAQTGGMLALGSVSLVAGLFELVALVLLFTSASNDWFRRGEPPLAAAADTIWRVRPSRPGRPPAGSSPPPRA